jgi:ankyrin repeat protein
VGSGSKNAVDILLKNKAKVNSKDNNGRTLLLWAIRSRSKNAVNTLLKKKAKVNFKDNNG